MHLVSISQFVTLQNSVITGIVKRLFDFSDVTTYYESVILSSMLHVSEYYGPFKKHTYPLRFHKLKFHWAKTKTLTQNVKKKVKAATNHWRTKISSLQSSVWDDS